VGILDKSKPLGDLTQAQLNSPNLSGAALKETRRLHEIKQKELAERAGGISQALVSQVENGATMTEEVGTLLWNAIHAIILEKGEKQISEARKRAQRLRGTPEGETEAKRAGAWFEGFYAAGGMQGWLSANEKESSEKLVAAQDQVIEGLRKQLADLKELKGWEQIEFLLKRMDGMEKQLADFARLNGLRMTETVAKAEADELAEQLEQDLRKDSE
jgi:transcriptional regulator with XRE-family HTH domain